MLVTSHTHAAVLQALYEAVKSDENGSGPLAPHLLELKDKVLRIGKTSNRKIPSSVQLDAVIKSRWRSKRHHKALEIKVKPLINQREQLLIIISEWNRLTELTNQHQKAYADKMLQVSLIKQKEQSISENKRALDRSRENLAVAQRAWFRRTLKMARAFQECQETEKLLRESEESFELIGMNIAQARYAIASLEAALKQQRELCENCPSKNDSELSLSLISSQIDPIEQEIRTFQNKLLSLEKELINDARAVFCTLTKNYLGKQLKGNYRRGYNR